jgi:hypothetical protein
LIRESLGIGGVLHELIADPTPLNRAKSTELSKRRIREAEPKHNG